MSSEQSFRVCVDWAPPYELLESLAAFMSHSEQKILDLGPQWVRSVRKQMPADFAAQASSIAGPGFLDLLGLLIWRRPPGQDDTASFLQWAEQLTPGELYECLAPYLLRVHSEILHDLKSARDSALSTLRVWDEVYFQG